MVKDGIDRIEHCALLTESQKDHTSTLSKIMLMINVKVEGTAVINDLGPDMEFNEVWTLYCQDLTSFEKNGYTLGVISRAEIRG